MANASELNGPIIVWVNYGYDGWAPTSYLTVKDALLGGRHGSEFVITRLVAFDVIEVEGEGNAEHSPIVQG